MDCAAARRERCSSTRSKSCAMPGPKHFSSLNSRMLKTGCNVVSMGLVYHRKPRAVKGRLWKSACPQAKDLLLERSRREVRWRGAASEAALSSRAASAYQLLFSGLRQGTFHRGKVPKTRRGLRPPVPPGAARRASQEAAARKPLRSTGLSRSILPTPSRLRAGQWNRTIVTATEIFSKAARTAPERGVDFAHSGFCVRSSVSTVGAAISRPPNRVVGAAAANVPGRISTVGARIARPCREAASRSEYSGCGRPFVPPYLRCRCRGGYAIRPDS